MQPDSRKSLKRTLLFIGIVVTIILVLNTIYTNQVLTKKTFYRKELMFQDYISNLPQRKFDYIFFGDSHAFHAINPDFIPNSYNYGSGAENYIKTYFKLRKVLSRDKIWVDTIVLELDPHTFSSRLTDKTNLFNELELYSFQEIMVVRDDSLLSLWIEAKLPIIGKGKEFGILVKEQEFNEVHQNGWLKNKENFSIANKTQSAEFVIGDIYKSHERISNVSFEYFIKTLELAKKNNINVVFIKYPHTKEYDIELTKNNLSKEDYYSIIFQKINQTLDSYTVLDYYDLFPEKDYLFGDPAHLNYIGAEVFSKRVYNDLKGPTLSRNQTNQELEDSNFFTPANNFVPRGVSLIFLLQSESTKSIS